MNNFRNIIVIGASAGGIPAAKALIAGLSPEIDATILVVLHLSNKSNSANIAEIFQSKTSLICAAAEDNAVLKKGHIYVALPDSHLMVNEGLQRITQGPYENRYRPSIDVLFRSAAVHYGNRVIGIILSGLLDDGTSGMIAIQRCGGMCIVQDPGEAEYNDMPQSVLNNIAVDYQASIVEIPDILEKILSQPLPPSTAIPIELQIEADITEKMMSDIDKMKKIGDHSDFACPDCGGGLWKMKNDPVHRYRCFTGHVYTENVLHELQDENIEESLYVSIRMLEEKVNLLKLSSSRMHLEGKTPRSMEMRINQANKNIQSLKRLLIGIKKSDE